MPKFGEFETIDEPIRITEALTHTSTVWKARNTVAQDGLVYAVKCFSPRPSVPGGEGLLIPETGNSDPSADFLEGVEQLKKAHEQNSQFLAPIHAYGATEAGVWYATDFYPRKTLKEFINLQGGVESKALEHLVYSVAAGCLALQNATGRSHGNLKASNVLLAGKPQLLRKTPIHLIDPRPVRNTGKLAPQGPNRLDPAKLLQQQTEEADLRGIGELILQLVEGRIIGSGYDYNYPVSPSPAWHALGKDAELWRQRCNQLLKPQLKLSDVNLRALEDELRPGGIETKLPRILAACVALAVVVVASMYLLNRSTPHELEQDRLMKRGHWERLMVHARQSEAMSDWPTVRAALNQALLKAQELNDSDLRRQTEHNLEYAHAILEGSKLLAENKPEEAMQQVDKALQLKRDDYSAANELKRRAEAGEQNRRLREYQRLMELGGQALANRQWGQATNSFAQAVQQANDLQDATARAAATVELEFSRHMDAAQRLLNTQPRLAKTSVERARELKPGDSNAVSLLNGINLKIAIEDAKQGTEAAEARYAAALQAAQAALAQSDFAEAVRQAEIAVSLRNSPEAQQIRTKAVAERDLQFAISAAEAALRLWHWSNAIQQANIALGLNPNSREAARLKEEAQTGQKSEVALKAAEAAFKRGAFAEAIAQADIVLSANKGDERASKLKKQAQAELDYLTAIKAAEAAFKRSAFGEAITQADTALKLKNGDAAATKLKKDAQAEQSYQSGLAAAEAALAKGDFPEAIRLADESLAVKKDQRALQVKTQAQAELEFQSASARARDAFTRKDYQEAVKQSQSGLRIKNDPELVRIRDASAKQIAGGIESEERYRTAMAGSQAAWEQKNYGRALLLAEEALKEKPGDPRATSVKNAAREEQSFQSAVADLNQGNYSKALALSQEFKGVERFDRVAQQVIQEQSRLQSSQRALADGAYAAILQGNLPDKPPFNQLKVQAAEENRALQSAAQKYSAGDYSFVAALAQQPFAGKSPFQPLLEAGRREREVLEQLRRLVSQRNVFLAEFGKLSAELQKKKPFADLRAALAPEPGATPSPDLTYHDKKLFDWEILFGLRPRPAGSPIEPVRDPTRDRAYNLRQFEKLENDYIELKAFDAERKRRLDALRLRVTGGTGGQ